VFSHTIDSSSEDEPLRLGRPEPRFQANTNDFKVEILEFEGKLDPEELLDWLHTVEHGLTYMLNGLDRGRRRSEYGRR